MVYLKIFQRCDGSDQTFVQLQHNVNDTTMNVHTIMYHIIITFLVHRSHKIWTEAWLSKYIIIWYIVVWTTAFYNIYVVS